MQLLLTTKITVPATRLPVSRMLAEGFRLFRVVEYGFGYIIIRFPTGYLLKRGDKP